MQRLQVPVVIFHEGDGQPVQQLWMRWRLSLQTKILDGGHNAGSKKRLPVTIDNDTCGQGVVAGHNPASKLQPIARGLPVAAWVLLSPEWTRRLQAGHLMVLGASAWPWLSSLLTSMPSHRSNGVTRSAATTGLSPANTSFAPSRKPIDAIAPLLQSTPIAQPRACAAAGSW